MASADALLAEVECREAEFRGTIYGVTDGIGEAIRVAQTAERPVVIADTQDNPGGGGAGDTTEILRELVARQAGGAVVGIVSDSARRTSRARRRRRCIY